MIKIIVDCYGGDLGAEANVAGSLKALDRIDDLELILTGDESEIRDILDREGYKGRRITVEHAPEVVGCDEKPTDVIRLKKDSSMMRAIRLLRENDDIAGMVSTGSTGALVAAATLRIGRLRGVIRPAFCPILPTMNGGLIGICDSGANVDCHPDMLRQFAIFASVYLEKAYGVQNPRVGLLNIGAEAEKGDDLRKTVYPMLQEVKEINFCGNMEARELLKGDFDVVVCDGFSGNVLCKAAEGTALQLLKKIKKDIMANTRNKIGAVFLKKMFMEEKEFMNYQNYGGSVLLGTSKVIVKGHGSSDATAVARCIEQAYRMEISRMNERIEEILDSYEEQWKSE